MILAVGKRGNSRGRGAATLKPTVNRKNVVVLPVLAQLPANNNSPVPGRGVIIYTNSNREGAVKTIDVEGKPVNSKRLAEELEAFFRRHLAVANNCTRAKISKHLAGNLAQALPEIAKRCT